tara:strand:- start:1057 stop:2097 length:1041 start_codon:yes stop_codon:yes gene_type:complete
MKKPIPPKGDNPAALEKYNKELASWKRQATAWEIRQHEHDSRYGRQEKLFGNTQSYTDPRDYARRNFKLSTTGDTKGQLVDIGNNNALVTKEYKAQVYNDITNFERAQSSEFSARNRERLFGTRTPLIDSRITSEKTYIGQLKNQNPLLDRLRRGLSNTTAEGEKVFDYNRRLAIEKKEENVRNLQDDRLKIQNPKAYNRWIAPSKSGMDLGGNFEDLQYDTTNHFNLGDKTVEQDINWYKTPTKDGEANVISPTKVEQSNAYEEPSVTSSKTEKPVPPESNVKPESTKPQSVQQMLEGMKISKDRISGIQRTYGAQIAQSQKKGKNIQKLLKKLAGPITSLEMES